MTKSRDESDTTRSGLEEGAIAPQPFPDQEARRRMSEQATQHPTKRGRNRDWVTHPPGSLATD